MTAVFPASQVWWACPVAAVLAVLGCNGEGPADACSTPGDTSDSADHVGSSSDEPWSVDQEPSTGSPTASISCPETVEVLDSAALDGSFSSLDGAGEVLHTQWTVSSEPGDPGALPAQPHAQATSLQAWRVGTYEVELAVTPQDGEASDTASCIIESSPRGSLTVLLWGGPYWLDADLHLIRGGAELYDAVDDLSWCNPAPDWAVLGDDADDPTHFATRSGRETEGAALPSLEDTIYTVVVVPYAIQDGAETPGPFDLTVEVWLEGALLTRVEGSLEEGVAWSVGAVDGDAGTWALIDEHAPLERWDCE